MLARMNETKMDVGTNCLFCPDGIDNWGDFNEIRPGACDEIDFHLLPVFDIIHRPDSV